MITFVQKRKFLILVNILIIIAILFGNFIFAETMQDIENQKKVINLDSFIKSVEKFSNSDITGVDVKEIASNLMSGKQALDSKDILKNLLGIFNKEIKSALSLFAKLILIVIIMAFLINLQNESEQSNVSKIAMYAAYSLITIIILTSFIDIINMFKNTIISLMSFVELIIPFLMTLLITTGSISTVSMVQPIMLFIIEIIGFLVVNIVVPLLLISLAFNIVNTISEKVKMDEMAKLFSNASMWIMGIVMTLFIGVLSIEGGISSTIDGIGGKTAKAAVSVIPVVGKFVGDALDGVMGASIILKDVLGVIGIIVIICIVALPIIKMIIIMLMYYFVAAIIEPITDDKTKKCFKYVGDTYRTMLGILIMVSIMFIISTRNDS